MIQLAYVSSTHGLLAKDELAEILIKSRGKNHRLGITGMLLYKGGNVLQILEGEEAAVLALFETISNDPRHGGVLKLYQKEIEESDFPDWSMGFHDLNIEGTHYLDGFSEFLDPNFDMRTIKPSAAARLLGVFKSRLR